MADADTSTADFDLDAWRTRAAGSGETGHVELIVRRPTTDERDTPELVELSPERGLHGDRWFFGKRKPTAQVSLMNIAVARRLAGDEARLPLFGDNFLVDFDLSAEALPPGTRLRIGESELEVTDEPHLGCGKFSVRFGADALKTVNRMEARPLNLRGVYARVLKAGKVRVGDTIQRLRGAAGEA